VNGLGLVVKRERGTSWLPRPGRRRPRGPRSAPKRTITRTRLRLRFLLTALPGTGPGLRGLGYPGGRLESRTRMGLGWWDRGSRPPGGAARATARDRPRRSPAGTAGLVEVIVAVVAHSSSPEGRSPGAHPPLVGRGGHQRPPPCMEAPEKCKNSGRPKGARARGPTPSALCFASSTTRQAAAANPA